MFAVHVVSPPATYAIGADPKLRTNTLVAAVLVVGAHLEVHVVKTYVTLGWS